MLYRFFVCFLLLLTCLLNSFGQSDSAVLSRHMDSILATQGWRTHQNIDALNQVSQYIFDHFENEGGKPNFQSYEVNLKQYRNVIASYGPEDGPRIIVGAHYDVCGPQDGADDNASGIAGLLELARLLHQNPPQSRIDLVAYTLEEPPFFRSEKMGSYVHAKSLYDGDTQVEGMIVLEMIGYFSDEKKSQEFPFGPLALVYGNRGDFITVVKKFGAGKFARRINRRIRTKKPLRVRTFTGPKRLPGIDFSDHLNYWAFGYSALMITNSAFYRNKNYHEPTDTKETLDFKKMAQVVDLVFNTLRTF